jgi:diguanylate cyclase (GGDEF)-like protein/PAS domain S-box-containing protein
MAATVNILHVEDNSADAELLMRTLTKGNLKCAVHRVETCDQLELALSERKFDIVVSDYSLPGFDGMTALEIVTKRCPDIPFIFVSGTIGEERAISALKLGAADYVLKGNLARVVPAIQRALNDAQARIAREVAAQQLESSEERFRLFMQHLPGAAFLKDTDGHFVYLNDEAERVLGKKVAPLLGHRVDEFYSPDVADKYVAHDRSALRSGKVYEAVESVQMNDGTHFYLSRKFPVPGKEQSAYIGAICLDITERIKQEKRIKRLSRYHAVLSGINSAIVRIRDRQALFNEVCRLCVEQGGFPLAWIRMAFTDSVGERRIVSRCADRGMSELMRLSVMTDAGRAQLAKIASTGLPAVYNNLAIPSDFPFCTEAVKLGVHALVQLPVVVAGMPAGIIALYSADTDVFDDEELRLLSELVGDVSFGLEFIAKEEKVNHLAFYDALTNLPNRTLLYDRIEQYVYAAQRDDRHCAVVQIDFERFHVINDTLGRATGDEVLRQAAKRLTAQVGTEHTVARIGADHFAIALSDIKTTTDVAHHVQIILSEFTRDPLHIGGQEFHMAAKAGIAMYPTDSAAADSLYANAEAALKKAKALGERLMFYAPEMNARLAETLILENKLRAALQKGQFVLHYQPKVSTLTREILGLEALIRWSDPELGLVPPVNFISFMEETGLILDAGRWALDQVAEDCRRWMEAGVRPLRVAVNVSPIQLRQAEFVDTVIAASRQVQAAGGELDLEITETVIMENLDTNIAKLSAIRKLGVEVAIDDFGTGYASLSYLAMLPVSALKIDRLFVEKLGQSEYSQTIVDMVISLAHTLNLKVIAEGVETEAQAKILRDHGCEQMQGYLFSKPLPPEGIRSLLN